MILNWKRIQLRECSTNDYLYFKDFLSSENFLQYMTYKPVLNQKEFNDFLDELCSKHDSPEFFCGPFSILLNNIPVGMIGFGYKEADEVKYELWYMLSPHHAGKGIVQEALECILDYINTFRTVEKICAYSVEQNQRSSNLLFRNNFNLKRLLRMDSRRTDIYDVQYFELKLSS